MGGENKYFIALKMSWNSPETTKIWAQFFRTQTLTPAEVKPNQNETREPCLIISHYFISLFAVFEIAPLQQLVCWISEFPVNYFTFYCFFFLIFHLVTLSQLPDTCHLCLTWARCLGPALLFISCPLPSGPSSLGLGLCIAGSKLCPSPVQLVWTWV